MKPIDTKILNSLLKLYPDRIYNLSEIQDNHPELYRKILIRSKYNSENGDITPIEYLYKIGFNKSSTPKYDLATLKKLYDEYRINQAELAKIVDCTRSYINSIMKKDPKLNYSNWILPFTKDEIIRINEFISTGNDEIYTDSFSFKIVHSKSDFSNISIILNNNGTVKVSFKIPFEIEKTLDDVQLNHYTPNELLDIKELNIIWEEQGFNYEMGKRRLYLKAEQKRPFYSYANLKKLNINDYFNSIGYFVPDSKTLTDQRIIEKIDKYADKDKHIQICCEDKDYQYFLRKASNRKQSIYDFFKSYGYVYERGRTNHSISAEERHKELIERNYIVYDNYIYIPSLDQFYASLTSYARTFKGETLDEIIERYGYKRLKRKDLPKDYKPYDYTKDLAQRDKFNDEVIKESLSLISNSNNEVYLDVSTYFYNILFLKSKIVNVSISELISQYGFKRVFRPISESLNNQSKKIDLQLREEFEKDDINKKLNELKSIESSYKTTVSQNKKIERNTKLIKILKELYQCKCQLCNPQNPIPYICKENGEIYSEVHHISSLHKATCDDDINFIDSYKNTIVLCPYHHKYVHYHHGGFKKLLKENGVLYLENDSGEKIKIHINYHLDVSE